MNYRKLSKFIDNIGKEYNIPCYDISIYYNHVNVFSRKKGYSGIKNKLKSIGRNYYFMQSGTKIMCCVALMRLVQSYKASLNDKVCDYLPDFESNIKIKDMITNYSRSSHTEDEVFNFSNIKKLIEAISNVTFEEFIHNEITGPLKMKSTSFNLTDKSKNRIALQYSFDEKNGTYTEHTANVEKIANRNDGCVITTVDDYARFCEAICNNGISQSGYRLLNKESVDVLINKLIYKETEKDDAFVCVGYHGGLVLVDTKKKITIVYAQNVKNMSVAQLEMYPHLRKLVYECVGADTWSMGYNMFP